MTGVVVDASVAIKWLLPQRDDERDGEKALTLLEAVKAEQVELYQPAHWLAEVAAVVSRLSPSTALEDISDLCGMNVEIVSSTQIYLDACQLSVDLEHHLFDTLYHAVALHIDQGILVTADERYYKKALRHGRLILLRDF